MRLRNETIIKVLLELNKQIHSKQSVLQLDNNYFKMEFNN